MVLPFLSKIVWQTLSGERGSVGRAESGARQRERKTRNPPFKKEDQKKLKMTNGYTKRNPVTTIVSKVGRVKRREKIPWMFSNKTTLEWLHLWQCSFFKSMEILPKSRMNVTLHVSFTQSAQTRRSVNSHWWTCVWKSSALRRGITLRFFKEESGRSLICVLNHPILQMVLSVSAYCERLWLLIFYIDTWALLCSRRTVDRGSLPRKEMLLDLLNRGTPFLSAVWNLSSERQNT